jgi:hypothetical protein
MSTLTTFHNHSPIFIPVNKPNNQTTPYPSKINVGGLGGVIQNIRVSIYELSFDWTNDLIIQLTNPSGPFEELPTGHWGKFQVGVELLAGVGGLTKASFIDLTFDSTAPESLIVTKPLVSGIYKPTVNQNAAAYNTFKDPAPKASPFTGKYSTDLQNTWKGMSPNGVWELFVDNYDPGAGAGAEPVAQGMIADGWSITFTHG